MNSLSFQSAQITYQPSLIMRFAKCEPMKPAPPPMHTRAPAVGGGNDILSTGGRAVNGRRAAAGPSGGPAACGVGVSAAKSATRNWALAQVWECTAPQKNGGGGAPRRAVA